MNYGYRSGGSGLVSLLLLAAAGACHAIGPGVEGTVDLAPTDPDPLTLTYLGTGGWIIEHGEDVVMTGPLYSNPGFFETGVLPLESDTRWRWTAGWHGTT